MTGTLRGIHVFWCILAFFATVTAVDILFIVRAVGTFPGEEVKNSYVLGLDYNREVERRAEQARLGWTAEAGVEPGPVVVVRMPPGLAVAVRYHVFGSKAEPEPLNLAERAPGEYAASLPVAAPARVELAIEAGQPNKPAVFEATKTLVIP